MVDRPVDILVVCTGNIARSPFAEVLLQVEAERRLGQDAPVWVHSSGVRGLTGHRAVEEMRAEARGRGVDLSGHRASGLDASTVRVADLVLTMTEAHRDAVVRLHPAAEPRTFTLQELARLVDELEPPDEDDPVERVQQVARGCHERRARGSAPGQREDVLDPYGASRDVYRAIADEIEELVARVAPVLFGPAGS